MTLEEFLRVCGPNDYVGIWDISYPIDLSKKYRRKWEGRPAEQHYFKIKNIPYGELQYFLDKEICGINHTKRGYLVRIHNRGEAKKHLDEMRFAREIAKAIGGMV